MGSPVIWFGNKVKSLKGTLNLNGQSDLISSTTNPTSSAVDAAKASMLLNSSSGTVYKKNDNGSSTNWSALLSTTELDTFGVAQGTNWFTNPGAEITATEFVAYADAAGTRPVDGTGGSPNVTDATRTTSSPLEGTGSWLFSKDAANRQGEGWGAVITLPAYAATQIASLSLVYSATANYVFGSDTTDSDSIWYFYDVTNSQLIEPKSFKLVGGGQFATELQIPYGCTSIRVIHHIASTNTSAWDLKVDRIIFGAQNPVYKQPILVGAAEGDTSVASGGYVTLELNTTRFDSGSLVSLTNNRLEAQEDGTYFYSMTGRFSGNASGERVVIARKNGSGQFNDFETDPNGTNPVSVHLSGLVQLKAQEYIDFRAFQDSGSTLTFSIIDASFSMVSNSSLGSEGRVVLASANTSAGQSMTNATAVIVDFGNIISDSVAGITTGGSWKYQPRQPGWYGVGGFVTLSATTASTPQMFLDIYKNGSYDQRIGRLNKGDVVNWVSGVGGFGFIYLGSDDYLDLRFTHDSGTRNLTTNPEENRVAIFKISAPSQLPGTSKVFLEYNDNGGTALTANTTNIDFITKVNDSHAAWNGTQFKTPKPGMYDFDMAVQCTTSAGRGLYAYVDGVQKKVINTIVSTANHTCSGSIYLKTGELLSFRTDTGSTLTSNGVFSWLSITSQD